MEIPRLEWNSSQALELVKSQQPVVLLNCPLALPVANRWTEAFLASTIDPSFKNTVFLSNSLTFQYWNNGSPESHPYEFTPPTTKVELTFEEFIANYSSNLGSSTYAYLQQSVVAEMGKDMMEEYMKFSLEAALMFKLAGKWDAFSTNLLLVGPAGSLTPCHFDEQENLFAQLSGTKRVRLFPPSAWPRLYPYPCNHPCDRQVQVSLPREPGSTVLDNEEDRSKFPNFNTLASRSGEYMVDLSPGEMVYIPQYWFHQMEALTKSTSLSWWFKHRGSQDAVKTGPDGHVALDQSSVSRIAVRRNLESMLVRLLGGGGQASHQFFIALAAGLIDLRRFSGHHGALGVSVAPLRVSGEQERDGTDEGFVEREDSMVHDVDISAASALTYDPSWDRVAEQAVNLANMVLLPGEAVPFVRELAVGRFSPLKIRNMS